MYIYIYIYMIRKRRTPGSCGAEENAYSKECQYYYHIQMKILKY